MSAGAYAADAASVLGFTGGALVVGAGWRRLAVPLASGALARLVEVVAAVVAMVLLTEILGTVGWVGRWQLLVGMGCLVVVTFLGGALLGPSRPPAKAGGPIVIGTAVALALILGGVVGQWSAWSGVGVHSGPTAVDTLRYHLPLVARFAQGQRLSHVQILDQDLLATYDPLNAEMLHLDAGVLFGSDQLSAVLNLGWLIVALLAAGALGRQFPRLRLQMLLAGAAVASVPVLVVTNGGAATNDLATLALLLASVTLLLAALPPAFTTTSPAGSPGHVAPRLAPTSLVAASGAATGLALGTKFYALAPAVVLFVAVAWLWRRSPLRALVLWTVPAVATGSYWYARNWAAVGNPFPETALHLGPAHFSAVDDPVLRLTGYSVAHYLAHPSFWRHVALGGFAQALGPAWWALLAVATVGTVVAAVRGPVAARLVAATAFVSVLAYVFTPYSAGGPPGDPWLFTPDLRFLLPGLSLGLLASVLALGDSLLAARLWAGAFGLILLATWLAHSGAYPAWPPTEVAVGIGGALVTAALVMAAHWRGRLASGANRYVVLSGTVTLVAVVAIGGYLPWRGYPARRYADNPVARWAAALHGARIGEIGYPLLYPLFGYDFANRVVYLEASNGAGGLLPNRSCAAWATTLRAAHVGFVVVGDATLAPPGTPEIAWTQRVTDARVLFASQGTTVMAIHGPVQPLRCRLASPPGGARSPQ